MEYLLLIVGFVFVIKGADFLIDSASRLARIIGISSFVIGLTVVAFGTSAPEAVIGLVSGLKNANQVTLGNVIGSCLMNVSWSLGLTAIIWPLAINANAYKKEIPFCIGLQVLLTLYVLLFNTANYVFGIILLLLFAVFMFMIYKSSKNGRIESLEPAADFDEVVEDKKEDIEFYTDEIQNSKPVYSNSYIIKHILLLVIGLVGLSIGGNLVVDNSIIIATKLGMSKELIGLTIVSFGTTLPEFVTSFVAALRKEPDIVFGNIIGSNIFNILFVLGISLIINPIKINNSLYIDSIIMLASTLILVLFTFKKKILKRIGGIFLFAYYMIFLTYKIVTLVK